jgi:hypothetical protein
VAEAKVEAASRVRRSSTVNPGMPDPSHSQSQTQTSVSRSVRGHAGLHTCARVADPVGSST